MYIYIFTISQFTIPAKSEQELYIYRAIPCLATRYIMSCPTGHTIYHAIPHQTITYTMAQLARLIMYHTVPIRPYHIPCHACQTTPYPLDHTIYHVMRARPYNIRHSARPHHIPSHTSPGNTIYHAARPYHIFCHARQTIPYTKPCRQSTKHNLN